MANEIDIVSRMTNEWMVEAVGYREQRNAAWDKIKVLESHLPILRKEYKEKTEEVRLKYEEAEKVLVK
jgi:hypothetical protein